jgi:hypothetical protein
MRIINLTPHEVTILGGKTPRVIAASGQVARVTMTLRTAGYFDGIPLVESQAGEVVGLPAPVGQPETIYLTSTLVRLAVPERCDVVSPADFVRADNGNIVGCKALERNGVDL